MTTAANQPHDLSGGPSGRARLDDVAAWIDGCTAALGAEEVPLAQAAGRALTRDVAAAADLPPCDRAAADGFALNADETVGASGYNPLPFRLVEAAAGVAAGCAVPVESGDPLPTGADAVVRLEHAAADTAGTVAVITPVFAGNEVERAGSHAVRGSALVCTGQQLGPSEIGLLAVAGLDRVAVVARPLVRCLIYADRLAGPGDAPALGLVHDANGPMLAALVERDGGVVADRRIVARDRGALRDALALPGADLVLVAGGTGPGPGDQAAAALAEAGELAVHGVALRPGESAGAGRVNGVPVFLLPGPPAACLWTYELIAGRGLRRLAGLPAVLPFPTLTLSTARKIVSEIGTVEVCPVRCTGDGAVEPVVSFAEAGLSAAAEADGFVLVPEASEGYPQGAPVTVHLYPERGTERGQTPRVSAAVVQPRDEWRGV
jgi:molybdopterin molybdotransferase